MHVALTQLGVRCRKARKRKGLSQQRLADQIQISQSYLSKAERGIVLPTVFYLARISKVLNVGVDVLRKGRR